MKKIFLLPVILLIAFSGISQTAKQYLNKGLLRFDQQDYNEAMFYFLKAAEKKPKYAEAYYHMGITRRALDQVINSRTVRHTNKVLQFTPEKTGSEDQNTAKTCVVTDYKAILDSLNEVIKINPQDAKAYFGRGGAKAGLKDYPGAIDDYSTALKISPEYPEANLFRGRVKSHLHDFTGAIADFTEAIRLSPASGTAYLARGDAKNSMGDAAGYQADFEKALAIDPRYKLITYTTDGPVTVSGTTLEIDYYSRAIALNPEYADAYYNRGLARINSNLNHDGCIDLNMAAGLGFKMAEEKIKEYCH